MNHHLANYVSKRIDRPIAWLIAFGFALPLPLAIVGFRENGWSGALTFALQGLIAGSLLGLAAGACVWVVCQLVGGLDRPVRRADLWAIHLRCTSCDWHTTPDGPWRVRDCLSWPDQCPACSAGLCMVQPACPRCDAEPLDAADNAGGFLSHWVRFWQMVRVPRSVGQALWGHFTCPQCDCMYDKWGREVRGNASP